MSVNRTCMICDCPIERSLGPSEEEGPMCPQCQARCERLLDDDRGDDCRVDARYLTILAIDVDE